MDFQDNQRQTSDRGRGLVWPLLLVLAGVMAYSNSFQVPLLFDDIPNITDNPSIRSLWPPWAALTAPPDVTGLAGRPVVNYTLAVNYAISGLGVWSYHAVNLAIHVLSALVLFGIARRTLLKRQLRDRFGRQAALLAFGSSLLWMLHPVHTQAVTWIIQRCEILMALCFLLTFYCAIRGWESTSSLHWHLAAIFFFIIGVGSKEVIVVLPVLLFVYDWLFFKGRPLEILRRSAVLYSGLLLGLLLLALLISGGGTASTTQIASTSPPLTYAMNQPEVIFHYLRLTFWPAPLVFDYTWHVATLTEALPYLFGILLLAGLTLALLLRKKPSGFLGAWFFFTLAPSSSIMPLADPVFEYRMYLPMAAVSTLVVLFGYRVVGRLQIHYGRLENPLRTIGLLFFTAIAILLGITTHHRNADYSSGLSIWMDTVKKQPDNPRAHNSLGGELLKSGSVTMAIVEFEKALEILPEYAKAHGNLGIAHFEAGEQEKAEFHFFEALRMDPNDAQNNYNVGVLYYSQGDISRAIFHFREALRLDPEHISARLNLSHVLKKKDAAGRARENRPTP